MGNLRGAGVFLALAVIGLAVFAAQFLSNGVPQSVVDLGAGIPWWTAANIKVGVLAISAMATSVGLIVSLMSTGASPVATPTHLAEMEARIMAQLGGGRAMDALRDPALISAQQTAVANVLTSTDPLDKRARTDLKALDVDGSIKALMAAARADQSNAARRYRDAGALAFDRDTATAIDAYEHAAALDAADFWTRIFLCRLYRRAGNLAIAARHAQSALTASADERDRSIALDDIGNVLHQQGDLPGALKSFSDSLAIARTRAQADPGDAQAQRDLSVSYDNVGNVLRQQGDLPGALKNFSDSLAIARTRAQADPGDAQAQIDLGVSYAKVAQIAEANDDRPLACQNFQLALERFEAVAKLAPDWADAKRMAESAAKDAARVCSAP